MLYIYEDEKKAINRLIKTVKQYDYSQLKKTILPFGINFITPQALR